MENAITLKELIEEVEAMLTTCFVGSVTEQNERLALEFENGQRFIVALSEAS